MARKRRTLPKNFEDLIRTGDIPTVKAVFDRCSVDATSAKTGKTALFYPELAEEVAGWLLEQGADLNARDRFGLTPLHAQASAPAGKTAFYIKHGADLNAADDRKMTPLHCAAGAFCPENVSVLLVHGARADMREILFLTTPLEYMLSVCRVRNIPDAVKIAVRFLENGTPITTRMQDEVKRIGWNWPAARREMDRETLRSTDRELNHLYALFEVSLSAKPDVHDGYSPITVPATHWKIQHRKLWSLLVPRAGHAETMQGEAIRISGKIAREFFTYHGVNFGREHQNMLLVLATFFHMGTQLPPDALSEATVLAAQLNGRSDTTQAERLCELTVQWVLLNPAPIMMSTDDITGHMQKWRTQWKKNN